MTFCHCQAGGTAGKGGAMTGWPAQPIIYEVNTAVWLDGLTRVSRRPVTLIDVTADDWAAVTPAGVDAVWLMGVWERSPAGLALPPPIPSCRPRSRKRYQTCGPTTFLGSPYCVRRYVSPTSSAEAYSSGTAASWSAPGCSWPWSRGNST